MKQRFAAAVTLAAAMAVAAACSNGAPSPTSPAGALPGSGNAAPDGSTLKATTPNLRSPIGGGRIDTTEPVFAIDRAQGKFVAADFEYRFEVSRMDGTVVATSFKITGGNTIQWEIPFDLDLDTRYRWRARAESGSMHGPWSNYAEFLTIDYRGLVPRPPNGQWPRTGQDVVAYVADAFPEYLEPVGTLNERLHNMEFLRDRIIETAICGGMDVALNLKRGIGPHSHDAVAWRDGGRTRVMDIASAFDDIGITMLLTWNEVSGPSGYDPYPNHPGC